jgi:lysozyme family protein
MAAAHSLESALDQINDKKTTKAFRNLKSALSGADKAKARLSQAVGVTTTPDVAIGVDTERADKLAISSTTNDRQTQHSPAAVQPPSKQNLYNKRIQKVIARAQEHIEQFADDEAKNAASSTAATSSQAVQSDGSATTTDNVNAGSGTTTEAQTKGTSSQKDPSALRFDETTEGQGTSTSSSTSTATTSGSTTEPTQSSRSSGGRESTQGLSPQADSTDSRSPNSTSSGS